jgi:hypothetical protein
MRIESILRRTGNCHVCGIKSEVHARDLDFGGRYVCDECLPHLVNAEKVLRGAGLVPPSDELIEKHL